MSTDATTFENSERQEPSVIDECDAYEPPRRKHVSCIECRKPVNPDPSWPIDEALCWNCHYSDADIKGLRKSAVAGRVPRRDSVDS